MAIKIAAVTGGNWTAGATWVGDVAPTAADDAQLNATSGNVTIDSGAVARSLDCTGYVGTLTHNASVSLTLGDATAGVGNMALKLVAGMTYTPGSNAVMLFQSTSATQQSVTSGGKSLIAMTFNGVGSSYILGDANTTTVQLTHQAGTFNTGNFPMTMSLFVIAGGSAKTISLGSSAIAITGNSGTSVNYSGSNCTFTANTSVMTFTGLNAGVSGGNWNGTSAVFTSAVTTGAFVSQVTLNNVTFNGPATKTGKFQHFSSTITGTLTLTGNSIVNRILVQTSAPGTIYTLTSAVVSLSNVDFQDTTAAGAAIPWTGTSMGNALGNTNITFDAPTTQTNTGATGNYSDSTKWTSRVPLPQDNVVVNTGSGTITMDMPRLGADVNFTGFAGTADFSSVSNTIYGSLDLATGMTITGTQTMVWAARSAKTVTNNGKTVTFSVSVNAPTGTYTIQDAFASNRNSSGAFGVSAGTLTVANVNVTLTGALAAVSTLTGATLNMGTGVWSISNTTAGAVFWSIAAGSTVNASTSAIVLAAALASNRTFSGGNKTYGTLTYTVAGSTGSLTITGANTFAALNFSDITNARTLTLPASVITTVTNFNAFGTPGKLMTINSATPGTTATLASTTASKPDYLSLQDITATGTVYGGARSSVVSNVSGFTFQKAAAAGGGNWTAGATWVGGVAPLSSDSVKLDSESGNVTIDTGAVARSLDCTGYVGTLTHTASVQLILGNATAGAGNVALKLVAGMTYVLGNNASSTSFISSSATQQTITTAGKPLGPYNISSTGGGYILGDAITIGVGATFTLSAGTFNTDNFAMSLGLFVISGAGAKTLTLGSSAIAITGNAGASFNVTGSNITYTANTAVMTFTGGNAGISAIGSLNGTSAVFTAAVTNVKFFGTPTLVNVTVTGIANKLGLFQVAGSLTITGMLTVNGNSTVNRIFANSDVIGTARTITAAAVSFTNTDFQDITAAGAIPWTGTSMGNCLGNTNITFTPQQNQTRSGVGGNWSDVTFWPGGRVPLPQDNVEVYYVATGTITMDMPRLGADINFAGIPFVAGAFAGTAAFSSTPNTIYGSLALGPGMTVSGTQQLNLAARSAKTITSNGKTFTQQNVYVVAPGGSYSLMDAFTLTGTSSAGFVLNYGTFNTNNFAMTAPTFGTNIASTKALNGGTSVFTVTSSGPGFPVFDFGVTTYSMASATIVISAASATARTFSGNGATYGTLTYTVPGSTGSLTITGNNTFGTLNFSDTANARSLLFTPGTLTKIGTPNIFGTPGKLMTLDTVGGTGTFTLEKIAA